MLNLYDRERIIIKQNADVLLKLKLFITEQHNTRSVLI